jgi:hypothetical protein
LTEEAAAKPAKPKLRLVPAGPPPLVSETGGPAQTEMPFAVVEGEPITELPRDLYIPPYALEVFLEAFEGPLDLLLYLIRRQNPTSSTFRSPRSRASTFSTSSS